MRLPVSTAFPYMTQLGCLHSPSNRANTCPHRPHDLCGNHGLAERRGHADHSDERRPIRVLSLFLLGGPGRLRRDADTGYSWCVRLSAPSMIVPPSCKTARKGSSSLWKNAPFLFSILYGIRSVAVR